MPGFDYPAQVALLFALDRCLDCGTRLLRDDRGVSLGAVLCDECRLPQQVHRP